MIQFDIYTDGACQHNPGPGGWGVYCETDRRQLCGHVKNTTNNRMELQAMIRAFDLIEPNADAVYRIYTDSQYVYKGITEWRIKWKANDWKNTKNKTIENLDMWKELDQLVEKHPTTSYAWVRGHNGNYGNEQADLLATSVLS